MDDNTDEILVPLNLIAPRHNRTTCSDDSTNGNQYPNEFGYARCVRCAILVMLKGHNPYGLRLRLEATSARWVGVPPDHYLKSEDWDWDGEPHNCSACGTKLNEKGAQKIG